MLQNLPVMLSGISFFLPKIMLTAPIILQIILRYLLIINCNNKFMHVNQI